MTSKTYNKDHLISLLSYIGIGFISGAVSHGFFSGLRSWIMALLGIIIFIIAEYLKPGKKNYQHLIIWWLIFSIAVGMVSGGFQHLLDSPMRSLWIIPVGWIVSTLVYPYKEWLQWYDLKQSLLIGLGISLILLLLTRWSLWILPESWFLFADHH